jgi:hypothetical protein
MTGLLRIARRLADLSLCQQWRPDREAEATSPAALWGGVARKG